MENTYLKNVLNKVEEKYAGEPEFTQAVREFLPSIEAYVDQHSEIEENNLLELIVEPERIIQFRVPWQDDNNRWQVNTAYRVQFNSALGPYKGGMRFNPSVTPSVVKFLGFEQTFKNALTYLPIGGGKGGADFDPKGKSDAEIMRFCQSLMTELQKYIGPSMDVPAGDMGVGKREVGYLYGQYKRLNQAEPGVLTGKPVNSWGSLGRTEATGYGVLYFAKNLLEDKGESLEGKRVVISGKGNVAYYAAEKAIELGATVIAMSDTTGYIYQDNGIDLEVIKDIVDNNDSFSDLTDGTFVANASAFMVEAPFDLALPCATQNEVGLEEAKNIVKQGAKYVLEGANMPNTDEAVAYYKDNNVIFGPGKAVNAGGVAVSALEMTQNSQRLSWTFEEVDEQLKSIMENIYKLVSETASKYGVGNDLQLGANIAGFMRVSEAMIQQGLV